MNIAANAERDRQRSQVPQYVSIEIHPLQETDRRWAREFLEEEAGGARVVSRGRLHQADQLPGFMAVDAGVRLGLLTYRIDAGELEVVALYVRQRRRGVGRQLLESARQVAKGEGCRRLWLITTNDNDPAIAFYLSTGSRQVAVHRGALAESRKLKPEIPLIGHGGKPIDDEIEFEIQIRNRGE